MIRFATGGDGVLGGGGEFNLPPARGLPTLPGWRDRAEASSRASCSAAKTLCSPVPATRLSTDDRAGSGSWTQSPCWRESVGSVGGFSVVIVLKITEGAGCIKQMEVKQLDLWTEPGSPGSVKRVRGACEVCVALMWMKT